MNDPKKPASERDLSEIDEFDEEPPEEEEDED